MRRDAFRRRDQLNEFFGNVLRFDGAEPHPLQSGFLENPANGFDKFRARREIPALAPEIDSADDDFFRARFDQLAYFRDDLTRRQAATSSPHERNHAIGAAIVAAVLNLEDRPGAAAVGEVSRRELLGGLLKNVAG